MKQKNSKLVIALGVVSVLTLSFSFKPSEDIEISNISDLGKGGGCPITLKGRYSGGIDAYTGSAPDGASYTCLNCHGGGSVTPTVNMTVSPAFTNNTYVPGQTYQITYNVSGYNYFGFDFEINDGNSTNSTTAGTFSNPSSNCIVHPSSQYPSNVGHSQRISSSNSATFTWTAPTNATNSLYLFSVGLGVNGNGGTSGDNMVSHNLILTPNTNTSSIDETEQLSTLEIFPNPVIDNLQLKVNLNKTSTVKVNLLNINGQNIQNLYPQISIEKGEQQIIIPIDKSLSKGVYFVQALVGNETIVKRILIK